MDGDEKGTPLSLCSLEWMIRSRVDAFQKGI